MIPVLLKVGSLDAALAAAVAAVVVASAVVVDIVVSWPPNCPYIVLWLLMPLLPTSPLMLVRCGFDLSLHAAPAAGAAVAAAANVQRPR